MEQHAYLRDPQREREIHHLLDQIKVPDESFSDVSSDNMMGRSAYEPESQIYQRGLQSPGRHHEDFFETSINSTIAHTSPLSNLHLNEDSKMDSSMSQSFTPHQVSRMMDWSKNHITPAEGIFPQVSAPSMSIEGDIWESPQETPQPSIILRSHSSIGTHNQSKKSITNLPVLDLPTHEEKPSREVITFSPNNAEANWYFNPMQNSKRSSTNQSLKFPKNSFSTELMQGSALLAHAANHHFPSEISLSQVRDNAPIFDEIHRLKTELANLKVAFRSEQNMHEETKKELYQCSNALQEMENSKIELEDKYAELDEKVKLMMMKQKHPETLEQLRGKNLEYAKMQIKELKNSLSEKNKTIEDYKHALSQRNIIENNSAREKEIEELTYEITKLKIVNTSQTKQIKELNEKLEKEGKVKDNLNGEFKNVISDQETRSKKITEERNKLKEELNEKNKECEKLYKAIKELRLAKDSEEKNKNSLAEELEQAKNSLEIMQKQVSGTTFEKTSAGDYEFQLNKVRSLYEKKLEECKEENLIVKANSQRFENKIKDLEAQVSRLMTGMANTFEDEAKEELEMLQEELSKMQAEAQELNKKVLDSKNTERKANEQIGKLLNEKKDLESQVISKENDYKEQIRMLENLNNEYLRNLEILKSESKNYKDLLAQYEEELEKNRFAYTQQQQLIDKLKRQTEELKGNESYKQKIREEFEQDILKMKNSIQSLTAKGQFEKDELYQKLREKDQEIVELRQELEESFKDNEDKLRMDLEFYKEKLEKEKEAEIMKIKKILNSQTATQTSFDYTNLREDIKSQVESEYLIKSKLAELNEENSRKHLMAELKDRLEEEFSLKISQISKNEKENYERKAEDAKLEYNKKVENLKNEYTKNTAKMEQEFLNKIKSIENEYNEMNLKNKEKDEISHLKTDLERKLKLKEEELVFTQKHLKEVEQVLTETQKNLMMKQSSLISSQEELENIIKKIKEDTKWTFDREKAELSQTFDHEKKELVFQIEKISLETKKKTDLIEDLKNKEKNLIQDYEEKLTELKKSLTQELEDHKAVYQKDVKDLEKSFFLKEKKMDREYNEKISGLNQEFSERLLREQEKYSEMMSKKDILSKADNQRVKDEVSLLIIEKEKELQDSFNKKQKLAKVQFDKEIRDKETEIENLKENFDSEKRKTKDDYSEKINNLRLELQKAKRDAEKEQKRLAQLLENSMENARKEVEVQNLETLNKEKADWEKKEKNKTKILQNKFQKELQDREKVLKSDFEIEKNQALEEQAENFKKKIKQVQDDAKKYYEDFSNTSIKEKTHEIELKVRKELQDTYHKTISQLDLQHFQEKEKMREDFRLEMSKRIEEIRSTSLVEHEGSYIDIPYSVKRLKNSIEDSQELKQQIQIYKQKIERLEIERDSSEPELPKKALETIKRYEEELQSLSTEYKNYVLKTKEWLDINNRKKEEWATEKERLEFKVKNLTEKLADSSFISPEMLSPEETAGLVLGIFKRSNQDSLVVHLLQQNPEFISILYNLLDNESPRLQNYTTNFQRFDSETSSVLAQNFKRPKSVDIDLPNTMTRPQRLTPKHSSPVSISNSYLPENFANF